MTLGDPLMSPWEDNTHFPQPRVCTGHRTNIGTISQMGKLRISKSSATSAGGWSNAYCGVMLWLGGS